MDEETPDKTPGDPRPLPRIQIDDKLIVGILIAGAVLVALALTTERRLKTMTPKPCAGCLERQRREQANNVTTLPKGVLPPDIPVEAPPGPVTDPEGRPYGE